MNNYINNKNIYTFGTNWDDNYPSYFQKCKDNNFAFAGISKTSKTYHNILIKKGDIILLKQGIYIKAIGIAIEDANKPTELHTIKNNFFNNEELIKYKIPNDCYAIIVKVEKWIDCNIKYIRGGFFEFDKFNMNNKIRLEEIYKVLDVKIDLSNFEENILKNKLLKSKNLILTGAPGTGKTYLAKKLAASVVLDGMDIEEIEGKKDIVVKNQTDFVQFHPSYDYTDFVEGIKPTKDKSFERQDGIFKEFCKRAVDDISLVSDDNDTNNMAEYDIALIKYLKEFINKLANEANEENPVKLYGFKGGEISPIIKAYHDDKKIYFYVTGKLTVENQRRKISYNKFREAYKKFIEYNIYEYNSDLFVEHVGFWFAYSSYYGFLRKFYEEYNAKLPQIKQKEIKQKKYVFIIDEINRGDLNKILGELFYAIDPGYRGEKGRVKTQYNNLIDDEDDPFEKGFYIPENVYIIGTMNDIDRSVESMDFAIRRRFAWQEIEYSTTAGEILSSLNNNLVSEIMPRLDKLNYRITKLLGKEYNIGASYFLKLKECNNDFQELWESYLSGVLFEYFRGTDKDEREKYLEEFKDIIVNNSEINMNNND